MKASTSLRRNLTYRPRDTDFSLPALAYEVRFHVQDGRRLFRSQELDPAAVIIVARFQEEPKPVFPGLKLPEEFRHLLGRKGLELLVLTTHG